MAIVTGSGSEFIKDAYSMGADVLITGDLKYHDAHYALECGICVIDVGHFETEIVFIKAMKDFLTKSLNDLIILEANTNVNPFVLI